MVIEKMTRITEIMTEMIVIMTGMTEKILEKL